MYTLLHIVRNDQSLAEYANADDLESSCFPYCNGFEMICAGEDSRKILRPQSVIGVHLSFYSYWLDFWNNDTRRLTSEFVTLEETFTNRYHHTDEEVIDAAAQLINMLLDGRGYTFDFLMENLWYPGLRLTDPALTRRLLDQVHFPKKGLLLDTGHLLHTNTALRSGEDACRYLHSILDRHGDLCRFIRGVHLHQSLSGAYVERARRQIPPMEPDYYDRFAQSYAHVGRTAKTSAHAGGCVPVRTVLKYPLCM